MLKSKSLNTEAWPENRKLAHLQRQHPQFDYDSFEYCITDSGLKITFHFTLSPEVHFQPQLTIQGVDQQLLAKKNQTNLETLIFHLGLVEMLSYWKVACSPEIVIRAGHLTPTQLEWWQQLLMKGLGEFFYTNQIDFTVPNFVTLKSQASRLNTNSAELDQRPTQSHKTPTNFKVLLPLGGGKDSLVSLELIKKWTTPVPEIIPFALNPIPAVAQALKLNPTLKPIFADRQLDPLLLAMNNQGYFNGHTPFSAYLAFLTTLVGFLFEIPQIVVSNESSANECNTHFKNHEINHQFSKSYEFEESFQRYSEKYFSFSDRSDYFSVLRPITELQIAQLFSQYCPAYFELFRSCNVGQKQGIWCHHCSKCLFAFLMLFPFIDEKILTKHIFHTNLFEDETLVETALKLVLPDQTKPFDCVGSYEESTVAFYLAIEKYKQQQRPLPIILEQVLDQALDNQTDLEKRAADVLASWNEQHAIPSPLDQLLKKITQLSCKQISIYGLGREGLSTYQFLRQILPSDYPLQLVDQQTQSLLPEAIQHVIQTDPAVTFTTTLAKDSQVIFKSAGISPYTSNMQALATSNCEITSATQLFFELCPGKIIGVTGTKGKSTTTALMYHLLSHYLPDVRLAGNIGIPMLDTLAQSNRQTIFVVELSSHQLLNLSHSPHLAVIQAITPEHLDYYPNFETYTQAKSNITRYQTDQDWVFYNQDSEITQEVVIGSAAHKLGFGIAILPEFENILAKSPLLGAHNQLNALPAILIGKHFQLTDDQITNGIESFHPLPHRLEPVAIQNGVQFINDSLATTPEATTQAIAAFPGQPLILIAGGFDRGLDYTSLITAISHSTLKHLILFPDTGIRIQAQLAQLTTKDKTKLKVIPTTLVYSMPEAVSLAVQLAEEGDVVLMSPAAASFNLFTDYADRGNQFKQAVARYHS